MKDRFHSYLVSFTSDAVSVYIEGGSGAILTMDRTTKGSKISLQTLPVLLKAFLETIVHAAQETAPVGANGRARNHSEGPNQPGGKKKTADFRW